MRLPFPDAAAAAVVVATVATAARTRRRRDVEEEGPWSVSVLSALAKRRRFHAPCFLRPWYVVSYTGTRGESRPGDERAIRLTPPGNCAQCDFSGSELTG